MSPPTQGATCMNYYTGTEPPLSLLAENRRQISLYAFARHTRYHERNAHLALEIPGKGIVLFFVSSSQHSSSRLQQSQSFEQGSKRVVQSEDAAKKAITRTDLPVFW